MTITQIAISGILFYIVMMTLWFLIMPKMNFYLYSLDLVPGDTLRLIKSRGKKHIFYSILWPFSSLALLLAFIVSNLNKIVQKVNEKLVEISTNQFIKTLNKNKEK